MSSKQPVARGKACPYLGQYEDPEAYWPYTTAANFCHTQKPPVPVEFSYQSGTCLGGYWPECPRFKSFVSGIPDPAPQAPPRRRRTPERPLLRKRLVQAAIVLIAVALGLGILWATNPGFSLAALFGPLGAPETSALSDPTTAVPSATAAPPMTTPSPTATLTETPADHSTLVAAFPVVARSTGWDLIINALDSHTSLSGNDVTLTPEHGTYLVLVGQIRNHSNVAGCVASTDLSLADVTSGRIYTIDAAAMDQIKGEGLYGLDYQGTFLGLCVEPGVAQPVALVFDVPNDASVRLVFRDGEPQFLGHVASLIALDRLPTAPATTIPTAMPTLTPTASPTPAVSPTAAATPSPVPSRTPTATPTVVARATRVPATATPTPTATATQISFPAPGLLSPQDGNHFAPGDRIVLQWQSVGNLPINAYYAITVSYPHGSQTWYDEAPWVKETQWALSDHAYLRDLADNGLLRWSIQVMRKTGTDANGRPIGTPLGPSSAIRSLTWDRPGAGGGGSGPANTPVPPPP
ncbi:MAG: DUF5585 domain-containing protein [Anaerolineae bacterium]